MTWKIRYLGDAEWWLESLGNRSWRVAVELIDEAASYSREIGHEKERLVLERDGLFVLCWLDHAYGYLDVTHVSEDDERDSRQPGGLLERPEPWEDEDK